MKLCCVYYSKQPCGIMSCVFFLVIQYGGFTIICRLHRLWIEFRTDKYYKMECGIIKIVLLNQFMMIIDSAEYFLMPWQTASVSSYEEALSKFHTLWHVNLCLRCLVFWNVMRHWLVVSRSHFSTSRSHRQGSDSLLLFKMEPIGCSRSLTTSQHCVTSQKSRALIATVAEAWNHE
jgi:hypothetical protein